MKEKRAINNRIIKEEKILGYCKNEKHKGYLTKKELMAHKCLEKKCPYFVKNDNEKIWKRSREKRRGFHQKKGE